MGLIWRFRNELAETRRRPSRLKNLRSMRRIETVIARLLTSNSEVMLRAPWAETSTVPGVRARYYRHYSDYVRHQKAKLRTKNLDHYDTRFRAALRDRLERLDIPRGSSAICLAARIGTEVRAFHDIGCFAVGIDLNPGKGNPLVLPGDFHNIQFTNSTVDCVYTNSLDHAYDVRRVVEEIARLLKSGGIAIVEVMVGEDAGGRSGYYESTFWDSEDRIVEVCVASGLRLTDQRSFSYPWPGHQLVLCKLAPDSPVPATDG